MGLNVNNLRMEGIYRFDDDKYIMLHNTFKTMKGNRIKNGPVPLVFVFEFEDGLIKNGICGRFFYKKEEYDINKEFFIADYDSNTIHEFKIRIPFQEIYFTASKTMREELFRYRNIKNFSISKDDSSNSDYCAYRTNRR